jgi:hypothetical protein
MKSWPEAELIEEQNVPRIYFILFYFLNVMENHLYTNIAINNLSHEKWQHTLKASIWFHMMKRPIPVKNSPSYINVSLLTILKSESRNF